MKSKIRKLASQFNIDSIIQTAVEVRNEIQDEQVWNNMTTQEKTDWFYNQCAKYNLTTKIIYQDDIPFRIVVEEFHGKHYESAYFTVFLPVEQRFELDMEPWHLEIGGAYVSQKNGGIWATARGLKGKEKQISEVMRLHHLGE